jgi:hypothetical protein
MARVIGLGRVSAGSPGLSLGKAKTSPRAGFWPYPSTWVGLAGLTGLDQLGRVRPLSLNLNSVNFPF